MSFFNRTPSDLPPEPFEGPDQAFVYDPENPESGREQIWDAIRRGNKAAVAAHIALREEVDALMDDTHDAQGRPFPLVEVQAKYNMHTYWGLMGAIGERQQDLVQKVDASRHEWEMEPLHTDPEALADTVVTAMNDTRLPRVVEGPPHQDGEETVYILYGKIPDSVAAQSDTTGMTVAPQFEYDEESLGSKLRLTNADQLLALSEPSHADPDIFWLQEFHFPKDERDATKLTTAGWEQSTALIEVSFIETTPGITPFG